MKKIFFMALFLFWVIPIFSHAQNIRFEVDSTSSQVQFTSKPPLKVVGKTNQIQGTVIGNVSSLSSIKAEFLVTLDSLDTGIKQRNKTMITKCLETDKYPNVLFKLSKILSTTPIKPDEKTQVEIEGIFDLHGIKRTERFIVDVLYNKVSQKLNISAEFPLLLSNYQIKRPHILFFKFSDVIVMNLNLTLGDYPFKIKL
jgi:polyisoprenoid-binding protein YceI